MKKLMWLVVIFGAIGVGAWFWSFKANLSSGDENLGLANPASVNCEKNGGTLSIVEGTGGQVGMCSFVDGTVCEERAYMRGECGLKTNGNICTLEYAPVCALVHIQCITTPCDPVEQTFGNKCQMNANPLTEFLYEGECAVDINEQATNNNGGLDAEPVACTLEYAPVCAKVAIQCITTPCDPIEQTFGNRCQMNANPLTEFLHEGECEVPVSDSLCVCPNGYRLEGETCTPECYYSEPRCLAPSIQCQK